MDSNLMPQSPLQLKALRDRYHVEKNIWLRVLPGTKYVELRFSDCIVGYEYTGEVWEADELVFFGRCECVWILELT